MYFLGDNNDVPSDYYLSELYSQISSLLNSNPDRFNDRDLSKLLYNFKINFLDEIEDPASTPIYWVSKWVDYSDKYGLGYQLSDNSVGVLFNDVTKIILDAAGELVFFSFYIYFYLDKYNILNATMLNIIMLVIVILHGWTRK